MDAAYKALNRLRKLLHDCVNQPDRPSGGSHMNLTDREILE